MTHLGLYGHKYEQKRMYVTRDYKQFEVNCVSCLLLMFTQNILDTVTDLMMSIYMLCAIVIVSVNNSSCIDSFSIRQSYTHCHNGGLIQRRKRNSSIAINMVSCSVKIASHKSKQHQYPQRIRLYAVCFFFLIPVDINCALFTFYCHSLPNDTYKEIRMKAILQFHLIISVCYCCSVNRKYSRFLFFVLFPIH